jgi:hypothetical protein
VAYSIGRDLNHVFKKGNAPTYQGSNDPGSMGKIPQMTIPSESHENVAAAEQHYG